MKTKSILLAFAALLMFSGVAMAQYDNSLSMVNMSVSPNPVVAGGNVTIRFQLYNAYDNWLYGTSIQPTSSYPLFNVSPISGSYVAGQLSQGINSKYYNYTIYVPKTIQSGVYTVDFTATYFVYAATGTEVASSVMPVSFYVYNKPDIKVTASTTGPTVLYEGQNQTVELMVQNTGYGTARNITINVTSGTGLDILSPVKSFFISNLTTGSDIEEPVTVSAQNTTDTKLVASINYYSSKMQQEFGSTQSMNLSVAPSAQFSISSGDKGIGVDVTDVPVNFIIKNTGTTSAMEMQLNLQSAYPITPVASSAYVPELAPGQSANVTFLVSVDSAGVPGNYPVTVFEQWKQPDGATNQQFTGQSNYFIPVVGAQSGISNTEIGIIVVVVIAIVVIYAIRKRSKAKSMSGLKKK